MSNKNHTKKEKPYEKEVERLKYVTGCNTLGELGEELGYASGNAISNWKERGLDYNVIIKRYPTINVNYLKTGEGLPFIDKYEKEFDALKNRIGEEDRPYSALDLLLEALESDVRSHVSGLEEVVDRIHRLRKLRSDS